MATGPSVSSIREQWEARNLQRSNSQPQATRATTSARTIPRDSVANLAGNVNYAEKRSLVAQTIKTGVSGHTSALSHRTASDEPSEKKKSTFSLAALNLQKPQVTAPAPVSSPTDQSFSPSHRPPPRTKLLGSGSHRPALTKVAPARPPRKVTSPTATPSQQWGTIRASQSRYGDQPTAVTDYSISLRNTALDLAIDHSEETSQFARFESKSFLCDMERGQILATIFIPDLLIRKTVRVSASQSADELVEIARRNTILQEMQCEMEIFVPRTGIRLPDHRPLFTFHLLELEQLELVKKVNTGDIRYLTVTNECLTENNEEKIKFFASQTTVRGIWQLLTCKHLYREREYGLFLPNGVLLELERPVSSYGTVSRMTYKELPQGQRAGTILLKILLVESTGSKLMKLSLDSTVADATKRIAQSMNIEHRNAHLYRLFIPLGPPLEENDTLKEAQLQENDILEFKRLPPHLVQMYTSDAKKANGEEEDEEAQEHLPNNVLKWNEAQIATWLDKIGYGELKADFRAHNINGEKLFELNNESLRDDFKITALGIRKGLLREIRRVAVQTQVGLQKQVAKRKDETLDGSSTLRKQLKVIPALAMSDSYLVEERDVLNISWDIVHTMLKQLAEMRSWEYEGIFRLSGAKQVVQRVYASLKNAYPNFHNADVHDVASSLKHYLRSLEDPLVPIANYEGLIDTFDKDESVFNGELLRERLLLLPPTNYRCFYGLIMLSARIAADEETNKMNSRNLGIVFGPTVMRSRDPYIDFSNSAVHALLFRYIVDNTDEVMSAPPNYDYEIPG